MSVAYLFPGQGSQYQGMLHDLPSHPLVTKTINEASERLKEDVYSLDTAEKLKSTVSVQLSLLISSIAVARALEHEGAHPDFVAGHSVGAFGAAVMAKVLEFKDALSLVKLRAELMEKAYPIDYGMGVVLGLDERKLNTIVHNISTKTDPVFLANINSPDQIVISGKINGLERVFEAAQKEGARKTQLLHVAVPSHCPLLESISKDLANALEKIPIEEPKVPYIGNRRARALRRVNEIREDLALSLSHPVRWHDATSLLYELGVSLYVELPPGEVLTNLACPAFPEARSLSITRSGIKSAAVLIEREQR